MDWKIRGDGRPSDFVELREGVISRGLCTRCGGCVAACPVRCLENSKDGVALVGDCIHCGICSSICPGRTVDIPGLETRTFGRAHRKGETLGIVSSAYDLVASDTDIFRRGYFGGRISALLIHLIESRQIDAALLTDFSRVDGTLSVGSAAIARTREDVLSLAGSKYLFSPVLSLLRDVAADPGVLKAAIVCLPCHAHAMRKMEADPRTEHLTRKISLIIGLNCGAVNMDEEGWRAVVGKIAGIDPGSISSVDVRKVSSSRLMVQARSGDGRIAARTIGFSRYSSSIMRQGIWDRCRTCVDYPCYLSDVTFGSPVVRARGGEGAISSALRAGVLKRASLKRRTAQRFIDRFWGRYKPFRARRLIARRKRQSVPVPDYR